MLIAVKTLMYRIGLEVSGGLEVIRVIRVVRVITLGNSMYRIGLEVSRCVRVPSFAPLLDANDNLPN